MDFKIARKCFIDQATDFIVDSAANRIPANSITFCKSRAFIITDYGDINKFLGKEMNTICKASDEDLNLFKTQVRELNAERNESILTSIFRIITGTRHKTRRRQVTGIPPKPITPGVASPTIILAAVTTPGIHVTTMAPDQEALACTTVPDSPAIMMPPTLTTLTATTLATITEIEYELSVMLDNKLQMRVS